MAEGLYSLRYEPVRNEQVNVGVSSVSVSEARSENQKRKLIIIRNRSPNVADIITLTFSSSGLATSSNGVVLEKGESVVDSTGEGYECFQDKISAICATANGVLSVMER
jgi:hypothetical protein